MNWVLAIMKCIAAEKPFAFDFVPFRNALSKLLAKRAGTKLKTLVIDEGFGTQDTYGLENSLWKRLKND
jgi:hypothetical protein